MQAGARVKQEGLPNNLIELIAADNAFGFSKQDLLNLLKAERFTGRAESQTREFINDFIRPLLDKNTDFIYQQKVDINV
jgi:adenylosuccinate lyase